jgi:hypothetical protein
MVPGTIAINTLNPTMSAQLIGGQLGDLGRGHVGAWSVGRQ